MNVRLALAALCLLAPALVSAQLSPGGPARLNIGDPAPALTIDTWLKGEPVPELKKGAPYVVEFWATWCGPCRTSIPHLTELQKRFDGKIRIIGISSSERNGLADVKPFVEKMGAKMEYTVAYDKNGATNQAWMAAAGQSGIPTAFVVDRDGKVAWIGHPVFPAGELDRVIEQVVAGTYDIAAARERKTKIAEAEARLTATAKAGDAAGVLAGLDELMALDSSRYDQFAIKKFEILLFNLHDYEKGYAWAAELVDRVYKDQPDMLNAIAWAIVDAPGLEKRDLDIALRASLRAENLTDGTNVDVLDTLARVHFDKGNRKDAVTTQEQAVKMAVDPKRKGEMQARLDKYKAAAD